MVIYLDGLTLRVELERNMGNYQLDWMLYDENREHIDGWYMFALMPDSDTIANRVVEGVRDNIHRLQFIPER